MSKVSKNATIDTSAEEVWRTVGDFNGVGKYTRESGEGAMVYTITSPSGRASARRYRQKVIWMALVWFGLIGLTAAGTSFAAPLGFGIARHTPVDPEPLSVVAGDFNGDGKADVVVSTSMKPEVTVFLADGTGGFGPPTDFALSAPGTGCPSGRPQGIGVADFNRDGTLDLAVANPCNASVAILLGNGAGSFSAPVNTALSFDPNSLAVGDFNGDGQLDLAVVSSGNVTILLGDGTGGFVVATELVVETFSFLVTLALADFNGDGHLDMAVADADNYTIVLFLGDGTGSLTLASTRFAAGPSSVMARDFNGDGHADLVTLSYFGGRGTLYAGQGDGTFIGPTFFDVPSATGFAVVGDINGDGKPDIIAVVADGNTVYIFLGVGDGTFTRADVAAGAETETYLPALTMADFNGDGRLDLAVINFDAATLAVLLNSTGFGFQIARHTPVDPEPLSVVAGDFNGDGKADVVVSTSMKPEVTVFLADGTGGFGPPTDFALSAPGTGCPSGRPQGIGVADFNGDGKLDLAVANPCNASVAVLLGNGTGSFSAPMNTALSFDPNSLAVGDFNGDGRLDLAVGGGTTVALLLGDGIGSFGLATETELPVAGFGEKAPLALADFNGDGQLDVAVVGGDIVIFLGDGTGLLTLASTRFAWYPTSVAAGDFDGDGHTDLVAFSWGNAAVFLGQGDGTFTAPTFLEAPRGAPFGVVGDINGDGKPDIIAVVADGNTVYIFLGVGDGTFTRADVAAGAESEDELPALTMADFNGDGRLDLAVIGHSTESLAVLLQMQAPNTPRGNDVVVQPQDPTTGVTPVVLTFQSVTEPGTTNLRTSDTGPLPPSGFALGSPQIYYDVTTTATFSGSVRVCVDYRGVTYTSESALRLFHYESGSWVDVTVSLDTGGKFICADVTSLSPFVVLEPAEVPVAIDIKPGSFPNTIKLGETGSIPVAIFSSMTFDARSIEVSTLELNGASVRIVKGKGLLASFQDVNSDGLMDLVVQFDRGQLGLTEGDTTATITGRTRSGLRIRGSDSVRVVP